MNEQPDHRNESQVERIDHLVDLIMKYKGDCIHDPEDKELNEWIVDNDANMGLFEELTDEASMKEAVEWMATANSSDALKKLKGQLHFERPRRRFSLLTLFFHCTIAASLVMLLALSLVFIKED